MAIRGVLFDLDGTLLDHRTAVVEVLHVGDVHELDVVAARAAGLRAVHLDRFDERKEHIRLTTLRDLMIHVGKQSDS